MHLTSFNFGNKVNVNLSQWLTNSVLCETFTQNREEWTPQLDIGMSEIVPFRTSLSN